MSERNKPSKTQRSLYSFSAPAAAAAASAAAGAAAAANTCPNISVNANPLPHRPRPGPLPPSPPSVLRHISQSSRLNIVAVVAGEGVRGRRIQHKITGMTMICEITKSN